MILQEGVNFFPENLGHARDEIDGAFLFDDRRDLRLLAKKMLRQGPVPRSNRSLDANPQGYRKRAIGQTLRVEDKLVRSSLRGLQTSKCTMKYLRGDTFFNKWSTPLIPFCQLPAMKSDDLPEAFCYGSNVRPVGGGLCM